jgi:hypothetical protein
MRQTYKIKVKSPLIRPGLSIETECSSEYLVAVLKDVMEGVRFFNDSEDHQCVTAYEVFNPPCDSPVTGIDIPPFWEIDSPSETITAEEDPSPWEEDEVHEEGL